MPKRINEMMQRELAAQYEGIKGCIVVNFSGLSAAMSTALRSALRKEGIQLRVVKNSIASIAFRDVGASQMAQVLQGMCAIVSGGEDMVAVASVLSKWIKENRVLEIVGGWMDDRLLTKADVERLAQIPPKPVLYAQILGGIQWPLVGLANCFSGVQRALAIALKAIAEQKAQQA